MSGLGRRVIGMWVALAVVLAVVFVTVRSLSGGASPASEQPRTAQEQGLDASHKTVIVRVLGPVLY